MVVARTVQRYVPGARAPVVNEKEDEYAAAPVLDAVVANDATQLFLASLNVILVPE